MESFETVIELLKEIVKNESVHTDNTLKQALCTVISLKQPIKECYLTPFLVCIESLLGLFPTHSSLEILELCFRFLRNSCALEVALQEPISKHKTMLPALLSFFQRGSPPPLYSITGLQCQRTILQFCCNLCVNNPTNQQLVWDLFFPDLFRSVLGQEYPTVLPPEQESGRAVISFLLYTCVRSDSRKMHLLSRDIDFLQLLMVLFFRLHPQNEDIGYEFPVVLNFTTQLPTAPDLSTPHEAKDEISLRFFIYMLFVSLFSASYLSSIFQYCSKIGGVSGKFVNRCLMKIFWLSVSDPLFNDRLLTSSEMTAVSFPNAEFLCRLAKKWIQEHTTDLSHGQVDAFDLEDLLALLTILGHITCVSSERDHVLNEYFLKSGLINTLAELLQIVVTVEDQFDHKSSFSWFRSGLRRDIILVLANLSHRCRPVQDAIRTTGALLNILASCRSFDTSNQYIREWSVFALRNLTEGNTENQNLIKSLQFRGVLENEDLQQQGLRVVYDEATAKFSLI